MEAFGREHGIMAGQQFVDAFKDAKSRWPRRAEQQDRTQAVRAHTRPDFRMTEHGFDFRAKNNPVALAAVKQRLDPQSVAT